MRKGIVVTTMMLVTVIFVIIAAIVVFMLYETFATESGKPVSSVFFRLFDSFVTLVP